MYCANTFVKMRNALKIIVTDSETEFDQMLKNQSFYCFHWTKETLIEFFPKGLNLSPLLYRKHDECSTCLRSKYAIVQPY